MDRNVSDSLHAPLPDWIQRISVEQVAAHRKEIAAFQRYCQDLGVALSEENFSFIPTIGLIATKAGVASALSKLPPSPRDGLISFGDLDKKFTISKSEPGFFTGEHFSLMAHPAFRRGMHPINNFAPKFLDKFLELDAGSVERQIAVDENRVRLNVATGHYIEFDTWYGPKYSKRIRDIPNGTTKLRPPQDIETFYISTHFSDCYCLDVRWRQSGQIKTFEAMELKGTQVSQPTEDGPEHPVRYCHAEFDLIQDVFRHFDGAVQHFGREGYLRRRDSDFNVDFKCEGPEKARSKKIFKINGTLDTAAWVELTIQFFAGNPLAFEYFSGGLPSHISEFLSKIRNHPKPRP